MRYSIYLPVGLAILALASPGQAYVRGGGFGGARFQGGGFRASPQIAAPHYSGGYGGFSGGVNRLGYASPTRTNFGNYTTRIGETNFGNRTNFGNTSIGNTNVGNRFGNTTFGNTTVGNRTNFDNRIGNTTIGGGDRFSTFNRGNFDDNRINNFGNRNFINDGNVIGRETNVDFNRTTNVNAAGVGSRNVGIRDGWAGWAGYHGVTGGGAWAAGAWNRPGAWGYGRPWAGGYGWYRGGWRGWGVWPSVWMGGAALGAPIVYDNPYYVPVPVSGSNGGSSTPTVIQQSNTYEVPPALNYANPIPVPSQADVDRTDADVVKQAQEHLDAGRTAFRKGDYRQALLEADKAIEILPGDANSHEFRALCLFAQKKYTEAAATIYAVLSNGPGWDWSTMSSFYADTNTYQKQFRDLQAFVKANSSDAAAHFLLAYQYLVQDERPQALDQLRTVEKLQPKDQLSKSIADALAKS